jgi:hypothetical protein
MATSEGLAAEIHTETGLNGHGKKLSGMVLGKHRLFLDGWRNPPLTSWMGQEVVDIGESLPSILLQG